MGLPKYSFSRLWMNKHAAVLTFTEGRACSWIFGLSNATPVWKAILTFIP